MHNTLKPRVTRASRRAAVLLAILAAGCDIFSTDIANPNAIVEEAISGDAGAAAATSLVNGLGASLIRSVSQIIGTSGAAADELRWIGSREYWKTLDDGDISNPLNEYTNGQYAFISESRWLANYVVGKLEALDKATPSLLRNRAELARAYVYAGLIYTAIGENYDDFVITSDRSENGPPVGEGNMQIAFDSAVSFLNRGVTLSQTLGNAELQRQALGLRARAKYSRALMAKLKPARTTPANPYVNDAGANADAAAALALMSGNYRFRFDMVAQNANGFFNTGFEINQRLELRAGDEYVVPNAANTRPLDGIAGIKLVDPITRLPDPVTLKNIDECCRQATGQFVSFTATSQKEMLLILAEAAIARGDAAEARTRINAIRAIDQLPEWDGSAPTALEMLVHERRVSLFMQGRRLADHYRFGIKADRWISSSVAARKACFFPISYDERLQNPLAPQPASARSTSCS